MDAGVVQTRGARNRGAPPFFVGFLLAIIAPPLLAAPIPKVKWTIDLGSRIYASAVVADLTPNPGLEILAVSSAERKLYCLSARREVLWTYGAFTLRVTSTPTVADLDADGKPEILIATRTDGVVCLGANGTLRWKCPVAGGIPWGNVTVADADRNGVPELYWVALSGLLERRDPRGASNWTFQVPGGGPLGPLAAGDVDGDGYDEIVTGGGSGAVCCLDRAGKERWRFSGMSPFNGGPVIADVARDRKPRVLAASEDGVLYCLDGTTGAVRWNHRTFRGRIDATIAVGDLEGDGPQEVVYGDFFGNLYCLDDRGEERWSFKAGDWIESAPAVGDIDGDGGAEVVFGSADGKLYCLSAPGKLKWAFPIGRRISASPTLCDCDQDGVVEILIPAHNGTLYCLCAGGEWEPTRIPWPQRRHDLMQTACPRAR